MATTGKSISFENIKVGDLVAPVGYVGRGDTPHWTGVLLKVTKVTPKRFALGPMHWVDRAKGRTVGHGRGWYVPATPEMIAEVESWQREAKDAAERRLAFEARPEHPFATDIYRVLAEMNCDNHPLDRLTLDEWRTLHNKLAGKS